MATEVTKYSVYDPRIVQTKPKYAVEKGALSLTNVSFQAQTADSSSVQFNVQVPSENVFVDRAVQWQATQVAQVLLSVTVPAGATVPAGTPLTPGLLATAAFPLHQSVSQMSATINDATVTVNTQDVLPQVLRLADMKDARRQRTCPTMLDRYATYPDSRVVRNTPLLAWDETKNSDEVPNGGFNGLYYANATGQPILETADSNSGANVAVATSGGSSYQGWQLIDGVPCVGLGGLLAGTFNFSFFVGWSSVERLLLPPFIFSDQFELSTGLFGVQNFQVQMNMAPTPIRSVRVSPSLTIPTDTYDSFASVTTVGKAVWLTGLAGGGMYYQKPVLSVQFLTPALDIPLPPKSIVPYMEFPRYIATPQTVVASSKSLFSASTSLVSQTITLPNIPDLLLIYVKPAQYGSSTDCDWSLPITGVSLNFDNFSGLLSNTTQEQLYQMSVNNGIDMDWSEWSGYGVVSASHSGATQTPGTTKGGQVGLVGGPLVLRPGRDFALQTGQAPGLVGNFTLQFNITVQNFTGTEQTPNIYTIPISSGFFETIKGSSRIIKGVLTEQDILSAPEHSPSPDLERPVGAGRHGGMQHAGFPAARMVQEQQMRRHGGRHGAMSAYM